MLAVVVISIRIINHLRLFHLLMWYLGKENNLTYCSNVINFYNINSCWLRFRYYVRPLPFMDEGMGIKYIQLLGRCYIGIKYPFQDSNNCLKSNSLRNSLVFTRDHLWVLSIHKTIFLDISQSIVLPIKVMFTSTIFHSFIQNIVSRLNIQSHGETKHHGTCPHGPVYVSLAFIF